MAGSVDVGTLRLKFSATGLQDVTDEVRKVNDSLGKFGKSVLSVAKTVGGALFAKMSADLAGAAASANNATAVFNNLGGNLNSLRQATQGMISDAELVKKANLAGTMGINAKAFENLAQISLAAATKTGQSVGFLFDSIITGTARQSKMILDNLGLMINIEKANRDYAASLNKSADALTDVERKQAFMNEVAKQGADVIKQVKDAGLELGTPLDRITATLENLGTNVGSALVPALEALSKVLTALSQTDTDFWTLFAAGVKTVTDLALAAAEGLAGLYLMYRRLANAASMRPIGISDEAWSQMKRDNEEAADAAEQMVRDIQRIREELANPNDTKLSGAKKAKVEVAIEFDDNDVKTFYKDLAAVTRAQRKAAAEARAAAKQDAADRAAIFGGLLYGNGMDASQTARDFVPPELADMDLTVKIDERMLGVGMANHFADELSKSKIALSGVVRNTAAGLAPEKSKATADELAGLTGISDAARKRLRAEMEMADELVRLSREGADEMRHSARMASMEAEKSLLHSFLSLDVRGIMEAGLRVVAFKISDAVVPSIKSAMVAVGKEVKATGDYFGSNALTSLGKFLSGDMLKGLVDVAAAKLPGLFGGMFKDVAGSMGPMLGKIAGVAGAVFSVMQAVVDALKQIAEAAFNAASTFVKETAGRFVQTAVGGTRIGSAFGQAQQAGGAVAAASGAFGALAGPLGIVLGPLFAALTAPIAALGAGLLDLTTKTKSFARFQSALEGSTQRIVDAMEPFWDNLMALVGVFDVVITAAIEVASVLVNNETAALALFGAFKQLGIGAINLLLGFALFHNALTSISVGLALFGLSLAKGVEDFNNKVVPSVQDAFLELGIRLWDFMRLLPGANQEWISGQIDAIKAIKDAAENQLDIDTSALSNVLSFAEFMDVGAIRNARQELIDLTYKEADARARALAVERDVAESLQNVPSGFKTALTRFNSIGLEGGGSGAAVLPGETDVSASSMFTANIETVIVQTDNPEEVWTGMRRAAEREAYRETGSTVGARARQWQRG